MTLHLGPQTAQLKHQVEIDSSIKSTQEQTASNKQTDKSKISLVPNQSEKFKPNLFYLFLLNLIKFVLKCIIQIKISSLQFYYFLYFNFTPQKYKNWLYTNELQVYDSNNEKTISLDIPKHVCVILNENLNNNNSICNTFNTIIDSLSMYGVETITFYRFDPISSQVKEVLYKNYLNKDSNNNSVDEKIKSEQNDLRRREKSEKLNDRENKKLNINFLCNDQGGRDILVNVCKNIATKVQNEQIKLTEIDQNLVDTHVLEISDIVEPQMVINIGNEDTLAGFSPWHLRLSEIIKIPSYKLVNRLTIKQTLIKYNKIEKRFGK